MVYLAGKTVANVHPIELVDLRTEKATPFLPGTSWVLCENQPLHLRVPSEPLSADMPVHLDYQGDLVILDLATFADGFCLTEDDDDI